VARLSLEFRFEHLGDDFPDCVRFDDPESACIAMYQ
jgi:hypothetical protein